MKHYIILLLLGLFSLTIQSQENNEKKDTIETHTFLNEVIVIGKRDNKINNKKYAKPLANLDDFLEKSAKINMIKRGNYAWEPTLNNMISDRINVTIDGMQIFGACTDKMDPITSYVDISNLEKVAVYSGQHGAENGQTIGGSIDLKLDKNSFTNEFKKVVTGIDLGYESNSNTKVIGVEANYSSKNFYVNTDFINRNADNYVDGNNNEVLFSQYSKYNFSTIAGYKISNKEKLGVTFIFDKATDIGYPALAMDVSLAKATIASINYEYKNNNALFNYIDAKLYANSIKHVMDDTKRPNVSIHMDMPGWSDTYGFYVKSQLKKNKHRFSVNLNGHYNKSLAEMTMYPANSNEKLMFMLTWPDVRTLYNGLFISDNITLNNQTSIQLSTRLGYQNNKIASDFGLGSLQIFYPNLPPSKNRFLPSFSAQIINKTQLFTVTTSLGYGERAPSVSEGYGNYLYNSFDNFDYIGNPNLKNEKSLEFNSKIDFKNNDLTIGFENSLFYISDYIIGVINPDIKPMVIGADGVKVYSSLNNVLQFNSSLNLTYKFTKELTFDSTVTYNYGKEINGENLPLISPLTYNVNIDFTKNLFTSTFEVVGAGTQHNFSKNYGEDKTKSYTIFNIDAGYKFYINNDSFIIKSGVENIFNTYYSTYSDWQNIPRMGRNIFVNLSYILK
ncbi:TonB-dependent receptor plug domain-containing protein [Tenacibaculum singaporense]|uniref:TonB-dependent receptor n=1 Tax=Tenacibaculum singaporense TaxID=2358479 RepID=A0A3Q8RQ63_9FLAO|nr:TonB-dependent receptor plug domain-containing protein [Tenacibaculum singaporense]AZJ34486.1 TonB-dependent receptor [Tenacibaculum singaporense]